MSWVTFIWSVLIGGYFVIALPQLLIWIWQRRVPSLFFLLACGAIISVALSELLTMRAHSVEFVIEALRWEQLAFFVFTVALVGFILSYLGSGRIWLGLLVCAARTLCLVLNFTGQVNLHFQQITGLREMRFLGETISVPVGVISPRTHFSELTNGLLLVFVIDACLTIWRQGDRDGRRRALVIGGSIVAGMLIAQSISLLIHNQVLDSPYLSSLPFALIVLAMAFEVGYDLFVAAGTARKLQLSEASLRESEERFRIVADAAPVLIWMSGPDKLCTFFNKAWLEFTGRTLEQEMGHGYREGLHPNDLQRLDTYKAAFEARDPLIMQYRLRRNDGEYRWILDQGVPRYDAQGRFGGYIGSCVDVTELLKKEKALREFEERVVLAAEAAHFGVWEFDTITKRIWVSDKVRELFQFPLDCEISYAEFDQRVHPDDRATRDQALQKAIRAQGAYEIEYRILLPDGNVKWIGGRARCFLGEDGKPTRLLGVSMDITERKQAEELFQLATEASPSGVVLVDHQGRILLVNAHIEELFGFARDELIGKSFDVLVPERFAPSHFNHRANFFAAAETRAIGARRELFGRRKDGSEFRVEIGLNPIQTPRGLLVLANVVDISARLAAEERALRRREQVELLSRVSLLGEMTASLAHELNQPLAAIVNNASAAMQYLEQGKLDRERLQDILTDMAADGQRAHDIMREVRNAIKKGGAIRGRINLNDVVKAVTHLLQPNAAAQRCKVEMSLAPDLPAVEGDPIQIQQVLINLVQNAFDAMHDTSPSRRIVEIVTNYDGGSTICVGVRDHGSGILDTARERLFEHFFTTKEEGLGMGLAIVRSIVEAHGGNIAAEDADGGGALFRFRLPTQESMPQ